MHRHPAIEPRHAEEKALVASKEIQQQQVIEAQAITVVKEITTSKGKFPIIYLPNRNRSGVINSLIRKATFGKDYSTGDVKSMIEVQGWDKNNYANYTSIEYHIKTNTSSQLILDISSCVSGASEHCAIMEFTINPITGNIAKRLLASN
jgi:hypothetical protein